MAVYVIEGDGWSSKEREHNGEEYMQVYVRWQKKVNMPVKLHKRQRSIHGKRRYREQQPSRKRAVRTQYISNLSSNVAEPQDPCYMSHINNRHVIVTYI